MSYTTVVSINPYFDIPKENQAEFTSMWGAVIPTVQAEEEGCLNYEFSFNGDTMFFCREAYVNAEAVLIHMGRVDSQIKRTLEIGKLARAEIHGPKSELDKLREPLSAFPIEYFEISAGFRK